MRIGLITDGYKPGINGVIRFVCLHQRTLEELGHEAVVLTWGPEDGDDGVSVVRSPGLPFVKPGYHLGLGCDRQARSVIKELDILHANQPLLSGLLALRYGRRYGIPVVLTCHTRYDMIGVTRIPFMPLPLYKAVLQPYLGWCARRCDLVTAPAPEARRVMRELGVDSPIEVVPYGIETQLRTEKPISREELNLPESVPLALFVGRLAPEKNVRFLLEALTRPELAHAHLLLVGDGKERAALERHAGENGLAGRVRFVGQVPPEDVPAYSRIADLFVTASEIEMLPVAVLEALAAGLPVVGLDVPWIREPVRTGVNGLLADPEVPSLARAWAALVDDEALRRRLSAGARAAAQRYSIKNTTARMVSLYEQVLNEHHGGING